MSFREICTLDMHRHTIDMHAFMVNIEKVLNCLFPTYTYSAYPILGCVDVIGPTVGPRERSKSGLGFVYFEWLARVFILRT